jgi:hypothetical protein
LNYLILINEQNYSLENRKNEKFDIVTKD